MKKTIILVMPHHFKIYEGFKKNLENLDFDIKLLFTSDSEFQYDHAAQKITNFFRKLVGDKNYKNTLKDQYNDKSLRKALSSINQKVEYALVIRPDYFSKETLEILKQKTNQLIAYQWDGLDRYPKAKELINIFDRFFLFDVDDYEKYKSQYANVFPITNFYFDFDSEIDPHKTGEDPKEIFFIGSFIEKRIDDIKYLTRIFTELKMKTNINLLYFDERTPLLHQQNGINFIEKPLTYLETLEMVKKADIVLDVADPVHNGLSFRIFETLHYSKKLITTNPLVKDYDFYSPDNILVWDKSVDKNNIKDFLSKDHIKIDDEIRKNYSFTNWIWTILKN
ncbi:hypothetical protein [Epilithonimonas lactis]|nr:hypothetical protein [Epilithonimonas lactis]